MLGEIIVGLSAAGLGSFLTNRHGKRQQRLLFTNELAKEWFSSDMQTHRRAAQTLIEGKPTTRIKELKVEDDKAGHEGLFIVIRFFERLYFSIQSKSLDCDLTKQIFKEPYLWWYFKSFEKNLITTPDWMDAPQNLKQLSFWFRENLTVTDWDRLKQRYS